MAGIISNMAAAASMTAAKAIHAAAPGKAMELAGKAEQNRPGCTMNLLCRAEIVNGKIYIPGTKKCIGWFNAKKMIGWCDPKGYEELLAYIEANPEPEFEPEFDEDEFDWEDD